MKKIYTISQDMKYANAVTVDEDDVLKCSFEGIPQGESWEPVAIRSPFKSKKIADFMYWTPASIVASQKAVDLLAPIVSPYVEVLPLECGWGNYYILNVTHLIDCINYAESEYIPFGDGKTPYGAPRVLMITKHVFFADRISGIPIFKDVNRPKIPLYVSDAFVDCVEANGLKGLKFNMVWEECQ